MTPKEKAKELVEQFTFRCEECNYDWNAKQCALISIDREIESMLWLNLLCPFDNYMKEFLNLKIEELKEVKQEIEIYE